MADAGEGSDVRVEIAARIAALNLYDDDVDVAVGRLPPMPLSYAPSNNGLVGLTLALHNRGVLQIANEMVLAIEVLWNAKLITAMALPARLLLELWASAAFGADLATRLGDPAGHSETFDRAVELLLGTRHEAPLAWSGEPSKIEGVRVKNMLKVLEAHRPETRDDYAFLSEASHPNQLQQTYLFMAGARGDNWSNATFAAYAEGWLSRLLDIVELSMAGILERSRTLQDNCWSHISKDLNKAGDGFA